MREEKGSGNGNELERKERELNEGKKLSEEIENGRKKKGKMRKEERLERWMINELREGLKRMVRRKNIIIGGDDEEVR